jgi:hypothetical protein
MAPPIYSESLRGQRFINWLGNASEADPNLLSITDDQIRAAFEADQIYPMVLTPKDARSSNTKTNFDPAVRWNLAEAPTIFFIFVKMQN